MPARASAQLLAVLVGVTFVVVGILGFVPGFTTHYGDLSFAGHGSKARLIGIFQVSVLQNIVHLVLGVVGIVLAKAADTARTYLVVGGVVYLAIWLLGVVGGGDWVPVNTADNWLHFVLGIGMVGLGFVATRSAARPLPTS